MTTDDPPQVPAEDPAAAGEQGVPSPPESSTVRGALVIAAVSLLGYAIGAMAGLMDDLAAVGDRFALLVWIVLVLALVFGFQYAVFSSRPGRSRRRSEVLARDLNAAVAQRLTPMREAAARDGFTFRAFLQEFVHPRAEALTYMLPISAFAVTWALLGAREGTKDFHTTSSQVIAVLILALAIEGNVFRLRGNRTEEWTALSCLLLALMAVGEIVAVNALMNGMPRGADVAMAAIVAGLVAVTTLAVFGHGDDATRIGR